MGATEEFWKGGDMVSTCWILFPVLIMFIRQNCCLEETAMLHVW